MAKKKKNPGSLLEPEARGGAVANDGLAFQAAVTLVYLPMWWAQEGFSSLIREAIGDTEAKFFVPGHGFVIDLLEVKNHSLAPTEFWREIQRFRELEEAVPGTYRRFVLACTGLSEALHPLHHSLRRIREPRDFYPTTSAIPQRSWDDYVAVVTSLEHTEQDARFLFEKVDINPDFSALASYWEALFTRALLEHRPDMQDVNGRALHTLYERLGMLLHDRCNQPIMRREIEACLDAAIPLDRRPTVMPIYITTRAEPAQPTEPTDLILDWCDFFGGTARTYPAPEEWNRRLLRDLIETRAWIVEQRRPRRIRLRGNRRLSAALAIGGVFSAVAGFAVEVEYRGSLWASDNYPEGDDDVYPIEKEVLDGEGNQLVVTLAIPREITTDVQAALPDLGLKGAPQLNLYGSRPITSPQQANAVVGVIKRAIAKALAHTRCQRIHLFCAVPSPVALFLGHRLNATAPVQCYEYVAPATYVRTCCLG
jgi:hypothetical protein